MDKLFNYILQGNFGSPQEAFEQYRDLNKIPEPSFLREANMLCWNIIAKTILECKDKLPYFYNGITLCATMITKTSSISDTDLELGVECIKTLSKIIIDKNDSMSKEEKESRKEWIKAFLDLWKEYVKEELKKVKKTDR